ncbi:uncharacterized protein LOC134678373 [Cydia fagiglandana]|uniref:uncharacterized protein LOC134678373 n=1 Tax=Cydia fagiglandana TaxID=1458189 RepID=UPI002FEE148C
MSLTQLVKQRGTLKCKSTNFKTFLTPYLSIATLTDVQASEIECRLSKIEEMYTVFDELQERIEVESEIPREQYAERTDFDNQYFAILASARELLRKRGKLDAESKVMSEAGSGSCQHKNNLLW